MNHLFHDIETVPGQTPSIRQAIQEEVSAEIEAIRAPGNYKDPIKIHEYIAAEAGKLLESAEERYRKTALSGLHGEVLCVSWALNGEPVCRRIRRLGESEGDLLDSFFSDIRPIVRPLQEGFTPTCWVGHNCRDFDLRFIYQRAVILGVDPGFAIPHDTHPSSDRVFDTMTKWAGWGNRIKLDTLCSVLGIPGKDGDGMDGSQVYDMAMAGEYERIGTYCDHDVERVRAVFSRMNFNLRF